MVRDASVLFSNVVLSVVALERDDGHQGRI